VAALVALGTGTDGYAQQPVSPYFFGLSMSGGEVGAEPWPVDSFTGVRLWDAGEVSWAQINTAPGVYNWRELDIWLNHAQQNNVDLNYCFGRTPTWASSEPTDSTCGNERGSCDAPDDLNTSGTGTDEHWKAFVTALATHAAGRIHYWELWDEFPNPYRWNTKYSTWPQLVRMASDARAIIKKIDPTAVIVSDSGALRYPGDVTKWTQFVKAGGLNYADVVAFHGYTQPAGNAPPYPETLVGLLQGATTNQLPWGSTGFFGFLKQNGYGNLPYWDTEGSWAADIAGLTDPDERAGFALRFNVLQQAMGVQRFYWYEWDNTNVGALWQPYTRFDLALADANGGVSTTLGFGDGSFQRPVHHGSGSNPAAVAVGDFNNDQIPDLVVANRGSADVSVLFGDGNGTFRSGGNSNAGSDPVAVAVADFNKDGNLDVVVANGGSSGSTVSILLGNGNGTFQSPVSYSTGGTSPSSVAVADFNQDGNPDVVVTNADSATVSVLLGNGNGTFQAAVTYAVGNDPSSVAAGNFITSNKYPDLAVANATDGTVSVLLNSGNGTFGSQTTYAVGSNPVSVVVGNFVKSNASIAVANEGNNDVSILLGNGTGTFTEGGSYPVGDEPATLVVADFNGDGLPDLATANMGDDTVTTLLNCAGGKNCKSQIFLPQKVSNVGTSPVAMATAGFSVIGANDPGVLLKAGYSYQSSYNWTVGNTMSTLCSGPSYPYYGVWTCGFTGPGGYQAQMVWDSSQSCNNNVCTYSNYTAPSQFVQYRTAYGGVAQIENPLHIGYIPIWLENQDAR
jgi:hypothetical protein